MFISPFTPLFFIDRKSDGLDSPYTQVFSSTDKILIQIICVPGEESGDWVLYSEPGHVVLDYLDYSVWTMNDNSEIQFIVLSPSPGLYSVEINSKTCEIFRVTDDPVILKNTTLIQYSMKDNRQRNDAVFFIDKMQYFFDFRVPGGFKDSNWSFGVENEQFTTNRGDIMPLFSLESTSQKFTLGTSQGCPIWFADLLNRLLSCTYVYFDGIRYVRKDTSVPETNVQLEGVNSFVFSQNLQRVINLDARIEQRNHAIMRRVDNDYYRITNTNINRLIK